MILLFIPYNKSYVESIFSQMNHLWTNYRNRMNIQLVVAELKIQKIQIILKTKSIKN